MEPEWVVMRVAYMVLFITLALMAWAYMVQAQPLAQPLIGEPLLTRGHAENVLDAFPPCSFNPLCSCSKPGPTEFGIVACHDVPFGNVPANLNTSRVFLLSMVGNNLQVLDDKRLVGSGMWRLEVRENNLNYISDDAFFGMSKFLSELDLEHNLLTTVPTTALRRLAKSGKLKILNLGYNRITDIHPDDLEGLPASITCLGLSGNMITYIQENAFANLPRLEKITLDDNSIQFLHTQAFASLSSSLAHLHMSNNLFQKIPFDSLTQLHQLKNLDISRNLLTSTFDIFFERKLSIGGVLNLEYNRISHLPAYAFQNFKKVSTVRLAYNSIEELAEDAFKDAKIDELDISHCFINQVLPKTFRGLENTLESLDMSFNNITSLPSELFENFDHLRHLNLDQNRFHIAPNELDNFRLFPLHRFSVIGDAMTPFSMNDIEQMRNLRSLNISNFGMASLTPQVFEGFGLAVEDVKISQGSLTSIKAGAFGPLTGLKSVDLSENRIERVDADAFEGVEHSLVRLTMNNAVRMGTVPAKAIRKLNAVRFLDLSSNGFNSIPVDTLANARQLVYINLRFNKLTSIPRDLFHCSKTPRVRRIFLSFNSIKEVKEATFTRLKELEMLELNENDIQSIHKRAFEDLTNLRILSLAGNRISILNDEAFQNLPRLQILDLSNNKLTSINLDAFEQIGTLSSFRIDLSYNSIKRLLNGEEAEHSQRASSPQHHHYPHHHQTSSVSVAAGAVASEEESEEDSEAEHMQPNLPSISSSSIKSIDLSHNNISFISPYFFAPISSTLIELDLSNNRLQNLTLEHLSGMHFIQYLKITNNNNALDTLEYNTFRESKFIQVINLDHTMHRDFPPDLFEGCTNLRVLSAKGNKIRSLQDTTFKDTRLEILNVANNHLVRFPENALARVASTLVQLDVSGNEISSLAPSQIECLQKLRWLDLSDNRIVVIAEPTFDNLHTLLHLDLSGNPMGRVSARLFEGIKDSLLHLHLANMSLETLPEFESFSKLLTFNSSFNRLPHLPTNFGVNVSSLRALDISGNEISTPPNTIWHTIPRLSQVFMRDNPIRSLANDSFLQLERLHELDISHLPLETVQVGLFSPLGCLRKLTIGPIEINPGSLIQSVESLQDLHLKMDTPMMSAELRLYSIPEKVSAITVSGNELLSISGGSFDALLGRQLQLTLQNTGLTDLPREVLHELGDATKLSLVVEGNNSALKTIGNPNAEYRREPYATYLEHLDLDEDMTISCSCETGWMEFWLRQWMEKTCPINSPTPKEDLMRCNEMLQMLRNIQCQNKPATNLMQAFVSELECGWQNSAPTLWRRMDSYARILILTFISVIVTPFSLTALL